MATNWWRAAYQFLNYSTVGAFCFGLGVFVSRRAFNQQLRNSSLSSIRPFSTSQAGLAKRGMSSDEHKLVLVVRNDLKMTKGKIAAQAGHATLACYKAAQRRSPEAVRRWERNGQTKVAVKVNSESDLKLVLDKALSLGVVAEYICDAGRTQVDPGTITVLGVGPAKASLVDQITGELSLL